MKNLLRNIPVSFLGKSIERTGSCSICKEIKAIKIGEVDYWDIKSSDVVECVNCGHIQLDPMLNQEETAKGCRAYYIEESLRVSDKVFKKNLIRNFRRGVLFGYSLKRKGIRPNNILELGPGSGYFAHGIQYVFPGSEITVMDVNTEVLKFNEDQHKYNTLENNIENHLPELNNKFDLVIARDLIEHVIDIDSVIENIKRYLNNNGLFHFITPNGHEDVWKYYLRLKKGNSRSELLINHVNYFDGKGLLSFLKRKDFLPVEYYTYKIKTTIKGNGWKMSDKLMAKKSENKSSDFYLSRANEIKETVVNKSDVLNKWYINPKIKFITYLMSWYLHENLIKVDPQLNVGHEIYGLFIINKKVSS